MGKGYAARVVPPSLWKPISVSNLPVQLDPACKGIKCAGASVNITGTMDGGDIVDFPLLGGEVATGEFRTITAVSTTTNVNLWEAV